MAAHMEWLLITIIIELVDSNSKLVSELPLLES